MRIGWTQPLCPPCFAAWEVGAGRVPREPVQVRGDVDVEGDPCLICGTPTLIYTRIDPEITRNLKYAKEKE